METETGEKLAGSTLSIDPFIIDPLSNILSSGHRIIANGVDISKESIPTKFKINLKTFIENKNAGLVYINMNDEEYMGIIFTNKTPHIKPLEDVTFTNFLKDKTFLCKISCLQNFL